MQLRSRGEAPRLAHVRRQIFRELHASFGVADAAAAEASDDEEVAMLDAVAATRQCKWIGAESVYLYRYVSMWTSAALRTWQAIQDNYEQTALQHGGRAVELHDLIGHLYEACQEDNELAYDEPSEDEEYEGVERCAEDDTCDEAVKNIGE